MGWGLFVEDWDSGRLLPVARRPSWPGLGHHLVNE